MPSFCVTITIQGVGLDMARTTLDQAGFQLLPPGSTRPRPDGYTATVTGPQIIAEVDADTAGDAAARVQQALPDRDYKVTAEPL